MPRRVRECVVGDEEEERSGLHVSICKEMTIALGRCRGQGALVLWMNSGRYDMGGLSSGGGV